MLFDIAPSEFLVIAGAAIIFIGPKDMPRALRTAGKWFAQMRRVSNHFRSGIESMIREAELVEMEKEWRERNAAIMEAHPAAAATPSGELMAGEAYAPPPALADGREAEQMGGAKDMGGAREMGGAKPVPHEPGLVPEWPVQAPLAMGAPPAIDAPLAMGAPLAIDAPLAMGAPPVAEAVEPELPLSSPRQPHNPAMPS